jgi:hypothetical protein
VTIPVGQILLVMFLVDEVRTSHDVAESGAVHSLCSQKQLTCKNRELDMNSSLVRCNKSLTTTQPEEVDGH